MSGTYYKSLRDDGSAIYGTGEWFLPTAKRPGRWMPPIEGDLFMCARGYHGVDRGRLINWLGPRIFVMEFDGKPDTDGSGKYVGARARLLSEFKTWNDRTARLFACDCAERAMRKHGNGDERSMNAIRVARKFANGEATYEELAAAGAAATATATAAAAFALATAAAASPAASSALATAAAAHAAAGDVAWAAERKWQTKRLFEYLEGKRG